MKANNNDPDMMQEYDFSKGVRGKYSKRYAEGTNLVLIDRDIVKCCVRRILGGDPHLLNSIHKSDSFNDLG